MASTPVRVLLVDDHPVMRDGLQQLLERTGEFEVVGHAGDGEEAERVAKEVVPGSGHHGCADAGQGRHRCVPGDQ